MALPQPLHIFRKDILHLWPETLITLLLFVAFAWSAPSGWSHSPYVGIATLLAGFLKYFLMPISWLVLISRLIQDESLVGDRQFWTSRPYHWASLLASKIIFLLAFIYLPFLLMQVYLLKHAGLYPTTAIPALLHNLLLLTVIVIVPLTALSTVTSSFVRMLMSTVGAIVYMLVVGLGTLYLVFRRMPPPGLQNVFYAFVILLPLIAIVYQYATRRTQISRIMLAATPLVIVILLLFVPAGALIRHDFPPVTGTTVPRLGALPSGMLPRTAPPGKLNVTSNGEVPVGIPVSVGGVDDKSAYTLRGLAVSIDAPGVHWTTPYMNAVDQITAGAPIKQIAVYVPQAIFNKIGDQPADVHLSIPVEHLVESDPTTWKATLLPFAVPGHGVCSYSSDDPDAAPVCRYPFDTPEFNFLTAPLAVNSCDAGSPRTQGRMRIGNGVTALDFDPVVTVKLDFPTRDPQQQTRFLLCPGAPLTFIEARQQGRSRIELDERQIYLPPLAARIAERPETPPPGPLQEPIPQ